MIMSTQKICLRRLDPVMLLEKARQGDPEALNSLLESHRPMLRILAAKSVGEWLRRREDGSDIAQITELDAFRAFKKYQGETYEEFLGWIHQILRRNVSNVVRHHRSACRDARRERYPNDSPNEGHSPSRWLSGSPIGIDGGESPEAIYDRKETALHVRSRVASLPLCQQTAIRLRYLESKSVREVATQMKKSPAAIAGLICRGLKALRSEFT